MNANQLQNFIEIAILNKNHSMFVTHDRQAD